MFFRLPLAFFLISAWISTSYATGSLKILRDPSGRVSEIHFPNLTRIHYDYEEGALASKTFSRFKQVPNQETLSFPSSASCFSDSLTQEEETFCFGVLREFFSKAAAVPSLWEAMNSFFNPQALAQRLEGKVLPKGFPESRRHWKLFLQTPIVLTWWKALATEKFGSKNLSARFFALTQIDLKRFEKNDLRYLSEEALETIFQDFRNMVLSSIAVSEENVQELLDPIPSENVIRDFMEPVSSCAPGSAEMVSHFAENDGILFASNPNALKRYLDIGQWNVMGVEWAYPSLREKIWIIPEALNWNADMSQRMFSHYNQSRWFWKNWIHWKRISNVRTFLLRDVGDKHFDLKSIGDKDFPWGPLVLTRSLGFALAVKFFPVLWGRSIDMQLATVLGSTSQDTILQELNTHLMNVLVSPFFTKINQAATYFALDQFAACMTSKD